MTDQPKRELAQPVEEEVEAFLRLPQTITTAFIATINDTFPGVLDPMTLLKLTHKLRNEVHATSMATLDAIHSKHLVGILGDALDKQPKVEPLTPEKG